MESMGFDPMTSIATKGLNKILFWWLKGQGRPLAPSPLISHMTHTIRGEGVNI
jgi:hypothetical protein